MTFKNFKCVVYIVINLDKSGIFLPWKKQILIMYCFIFFTLDMDECADSNLNNCDTDATCTNADGSYQCACNIGYTGDGTTCQGIE